MPQGMARGVSGLQVLTRIPKRHSLGRGLRGGTPSEQAEVQEADLEPLVRGHVACNV